MKGQMRCMLDLIQNKVTVRVENRFTMTANLTRFDTTRLPVTLMPLDDARNRNAKAFRYNPCRFPKTTALTARSRRSLEYGFAICAGLHAPAHILNQKNSKKGIILIQSISEPL